MSVHIFILWQFRDKYKGNNVILWYFYWRRIYLSRMPSPILCIHLYCVASDKNEQKLSKKRNLLKGSENKDGRPWCEPKFFFRKIRSNIHAYVTVRELWFNSRAVVLLSLSYGRHHIFFISRREKSNFIANSIARGSNVRDWKFTLMYARNSVE